jgi:hypothetical protein
MNPLWLVPAFCIGLAAGITLGYFAFSKDNDDPTNN